MAYGSAAEAYAAGAVRECQSCDCRIYHNPGDEFCYVCVDTSVNPCLSCGGDSSWLAWRVVHYPICSDCFDYWDRIYTGIFVECVDFWSRLYDTLFSPSASARRLFTGAGCASSLKGGIK